MFHYAYLLIDKNIDECITLKIPYLYCGIRSSKMFTDNSYLSSSKYVKNAIKRGRTFNKIILKYFDTRNEALIYESSIVNLLWIKSPITYNICVGGNGAGDFHFSKMSHNKKKFYEMGGVPWNKGLTYSEEECLKIKDAINMHWENNKELYITWKNKISKALKHKWQTEEYKSKQNNLDYLHTKEIAEKISKSNSITYNTKEMKDKSSNKFKKLWQTEEYKEKQNNLNYLHIKEIVEKISRSNKKYWSSEDGRKKASERSKRLWNSEEYKTNNDLSYLRTPEVKKKISDAAKKQFLVILKCPKCGHEGRGPWMYQKHFKNCKNVLGV